MYNVKLMTEGQRRDLQHYRLSDVSYEEKKKEIEDLVKTQIGSVNLTKLKEGLHFSTPFYYPFFADNLREAADIVADMLQSIYWLSNHLKNEQTQESKFLYRIYAYYVLEK